jgi:hypothetical protein
VQALHWRCAACLLDSNAACVTGQPHGCMLSRSARGLAALYGGEAGLALGQGRARIGPRPGSHWAKAGLALGQGRARIAKAGLADRCCAAHLWPPTHDDHGLSSFTARMHGGDGRSARYSIRYSIQYSRGYTRVVRCQASACRHSARSRCHGSCWRSAQVSRSAPTLQQPRDR